MYNTVYWTCVIGLLARKAVSAFIFGGEEGEAKGNMGTNTLELAPSCSLIVSAKL